MKVHVNLFNYFNLLRGAALSLTALACLALSGPVASADWADQLGESSGISRDVAPAGASAAGSGASLDTSALSRDLIADMRIGSFGSAGMSEVMPLNSPGNMGGTEASNVPAVPNRM